MKLLALLISGFNHAEISQNQPLRFTKKTEMKRRNIFLVKEKKSSLSSFWFFPSLLKEDKLLTIDFYFFPSPISNTLASNPAPTTIHTTIIMYSYRDFCIKRNCTLAIMDATIITTPSTVKTLAKKESGFTTHQNTPKINGTITKPDGIVILPK